MDIQGTITIFPKERGKFKFFEGTITRKRDDETYSNCSIECKFVGKNFDEKFTKQMKVGCYYVVKVISGYLSIDEWADKLSGENRKKIVAIITDGVIKSDGKIATK